MMEKRLAPWGVDEVMSLNGYQLSGNMHPFTCPREHVYTWKPGELPVECDRDELFELFGENLRLGHVLLMATEDGWVCPHELCDYTQDWAWVFMLEGRWHRHWSEVLA